MIALKRLAPVCEPNVKTRKNIQENRIDEASAKNFTNRKFMQFAPHIGRAGPQSHFFAGFPSLTVAERASAHQTELQVGKKCLETAIESRRRKFRDFYRDRDPHSALLWSRAKALKMAEGKGFLDVTRDSGMEDLIDGSDPFFHEHRLAFINGVRNAIGWTEL